MNIGDKRLVYAQTFVIPKGEKACGEITVDVPTEPFSIPASSTIGQEIKIPSVSTPLNLYVEIFLDHAPSEENANRLKWKFESEPKPSWYLTISGPFSGLPAMTDKFLDFASVSGKKLGFWASFFAGTNSCTVHLQLLMEE